MDESRLRQSSRASSRRYTQDGQLQAIPEPTNEISFPATIDSRSDTNASINLPNTKDIQLNRSSLEERSEEQSRSHDAQNSDSARSDLDDASYESSMVAAESRPRKTQETREIVTYSKATQTFDEPEPPADTVLLDTVTERERLIARLREEIAEEMRSQEREIKLQAVANTPVVSTEPTLSTDEKSSMLQSAEYNEFLNKTAKVLEDVLVEDLPQETDYTADLDEINASSSSATLRQVVQFQDEQTRERIVTSIDWSTRFHELVLVTYSKHQSLVGEIQGLVYVWNCKQPLKPQFVFECQAEVQKAIFSPHHPHLIVGATYSGQIVLWSTRARSQPILASPLVGKGHTYPITGLDMVGTRQANSIVSTSSDGLVCTWSIDMLAQPNDVVELVLLPPSKVEEVSPSAVTHSSSDASTFLAGTEEGKIYSVNRQDRAGSKAGIDPRMVYKGHAAMITGLQYHAAKGVMDFSDLVVSSSLDWSIKVWRVKTPTTSSASQNGANAMVQEPLLDLPTEEIVYDVRWSPSRPGVFASVDGAGNCHIYNLCQNFEVPVLSGRVVVTDPDTGKTMPARALNKVAWDHDFGRRVAVGGIQGALTVFEVPASLGGKESDHESWYKLSNRLKGLA